MELFIDTAEVNEIREAATWGIIDGVTTNPSLVAKSGRSRDEVIKEIVALIDGPISAEVNSIEATGMIAEAEKLTKIHPNVVIKLPLTIEGIKACKILSSKGVKTNVTLCFSPNQALLAAKAGATYVSPFIGRIDDAGNDGMALIQEIRALYDNFGFKTKILAASIRHPSHVRDAALLGSDVATAPFKVLKQLYEHPLTEKGLASFINDFNKSLSR